MIDHARPNHVEVDVAHAAQEVFIAVQQGYVILGERFARQGHALIKGQEPAEDGRP